MLFTKIMNYFKGYMIIKITSRYPERLINLCSKNNILLWDIKRGGDEAVYAKISRQGFKKIRKITKNTDSHIHIISKYGFFEVAKRYKKRKWFVLVIAMFLFVMLTSNLFIWDIEIVGNENVKKDEILQNLKELGLKKGALRGSFDEKEIKNAMLLKMPTLSWLWPDLRGTKVVVEVKEKLLMPEIFNPEDFKNIIAKKDGVIHSMTVKSGNPMVKIGDTVISGDVLVSGVVESQKELPARYVQADAEVFARVWYEKSRAFSTNFIKKTETGKTEKKYRLKIWGMEIKLYKKDEPDFSNYTKEEKVWEFSPFGDYSGIELNYELYREVTEKIEKQSVESTAEDAYLLIAEEIEKEAGGDSEIVAVDKSFEEIDEDTILVKVVAEYIENIAEKK